MSFVFFALVFATNLSERLLTPKEKAALYEAEGIHASVNIEGEASGKKLLLLLSHCTPQRE